MAENPPDKTWRNKNRSNRFPVATNSDIPVARLQFQRPIAPKFIDRTSFLTFIINNRPARPTGSVGQLSTPRLMSRVLCPSTTSMLTPVSLFTSICLFLLVVDGTKDLHSGRFGNERIQKPTVWTASWSFDDRLVAVGNSAGELAIYETRNWKKIKSWKFSNTTICRVKWNPKYPILAIAAFSPEKQPAIIQLYDASTNKIISHLPDTLLGRGVSWSPSGEEVAFVGNQGSISLYSKSGKFRKTLSFRNQGSLFDIAWHPTENILLAVEENIFLIDIDHDRLIGTYEDGSTNKGILCCAWHPSGKIFVTGDYGHENEGAEPSYLKFWEQSGTLLKCIRESKYEYRNLSWTKDGKYLAAAADLLLIADKKGTIVSRVKFDDNNLWAVEWNHKGDKILSGDQAGHIRVSDLKGNILRIFDQ